MGNNLRFNYFEIAAVIIFGIGFTMLFLNRNLVKKIIGFNFMDSGVFLFLASGGYIDGRIDHPGKRNVREQLYQSGPGRPGADGNRGLRQRDGRPAGADGAAVPAVPHPGAG